MTALAMALVLTGCAGANGSSGGSRDVDLDRQSIFDSILREAEESGHFETETAGSQVRYVKEIREGDEGWSTSIGRSIPFAETYRIVAEPHEPDGLLITQRINGDAIVSGVKLTFEPLSEERTRVHYEIVPASGPEVRNFGEFIDSCELAGILASLGKLPSDSSEAARAEEKAALEKCNEAGRALS
jgi:hypothetical protein